jgi:Protein of unknown function (DUF3951)
MYFLLGATTIFAVSIVILIILVVYKMAATRIIPSNYYTPFDYISSQTTVEFHEEKEEEEQVDGQGDDKEKNNQCPYYKFQ